MRFQGSDLRIVLKPIVSRIDFNKRPISSFKCEARNIHDLSESCDPAPYGAERTGQLRADIIEKLTLLSKNLASSKLGHVILIAARLADKNAMMARVHTAMHDIIRQPFLAFLSGHGLKADRDAVGLTLVAPILYYHLFLADQKQINVDPIVDRFLFGPG